jgi:hypothetical protein
MVRSHSREKASGSASEISVRLDQVDGLYRGREFKLARQAELDVGTDLGGKIRLTEWTADLVFECPAHGLVNASPEYPVVLSMARCVEEPDEQRVFAVLDSGNERFHLEALQSGVPQGLQHVAVRLPH